MASITRIFLFSKPARKPFGPCARWRNWKTRFSFYTKTSKAHIFLLSKPVRKPFGPCARWRNWEKRFHFIARQTTRMFHFLKAHQEAVRTLVWRINLKMLHSIHDKHTLCDGNESICRLIPFSKPARKPFGPCARWRTGNSAVHRPALRGTNCACMRIRCL